MNGTDDSTPHDTDRVAVPGAPALPPLNLDPAASHRRNNSSHPSPGTRPKSMWAAAVSLIISGLCWLATPLVLWIYLRSLVRDVVEDSTGTARSTLIEWVQSISPELLHGTVEQLGDQQITRAVSTLLFDQIAGSTWLLIGLAGIFLAGYIAAAIAVLRCSRIGRIITTVFIGVAYIPLIIGAVMMIVSRLSLSLLGGFATSAAEWVSDLIAGWQGAPEMLTQAVTEMFAADHAGTLVSALGSMFSMWAMLLIGVLICHTISLVLLWMKPARTWFGPGQVL